MSDNSKRYVSPRHFRTQTGALTRKTDKLELRSRDAELLTSPADNVSDTPSLLSNTTSDPLTRDETFLGRRGWGRGRRGMIPDK